MGVCYSVHGKSENGYIDGKRFGTKREAEIAIKKLIMKNCDICPELRAISRKGLPSPKYRASVVEYLKVFFLSGKHPSCEMIDYSDYAGDIRSFPPVRDPEEEEYATGCERKMGFIEHYDNQNVSDYDRELGFIFSVGKPGMHLEFLGTQYPYLGSRYTFRICPEGVIFNFEPGSEIGGRPAVDLRSCINHGNIPPKLTGSFFTVMLLDMLLNETQPLPISLSDQDDKDPDACLEWMMESELYTRMNDDFVLPAALKLSDRTIGRYIELFKDFGYDVKDQQREWQEEDYKGDNIHRVEHKYYIPPFICKRDADRIISCVENSSIDSEQKSELIEKFKNMSGYHRFSADIFEESDLPMPKHIDDGWSNKYFSLIIWNMLRLCGRSLPVTNSKGENIKDLIETHYGVEIRRAAISTNIKSMMAMGISIKEDKREYLFDTSAQLSASQMEVLKNCIADGADGEYLISRLDKKFPMGAY